MTKEHWFEGCKVCDAGMCQEYDYLVDEKRFPATKAAEQLRKDAIVYVMRTYEIDEDTARNIVPNESSLRQKWLWLKGLKNNQMPVQNEQPTKLSTFNETNDNIKWAKWTWNPVTGCKHGCQYCYARDIANRFYPPEIGFNPHFYPSRLDAPKNTTIPKGRENEVGIKNVFVCSMADLLGEWVPADWIQKVLSAVQESPQWTYLFLTKNPKRYLEFKWPLNCCLGATADTQERSDTALQVFMELQDGNIRFLSCEPLMEPITLQMESEDIESPHVDLEWLIIGGRSKTSGMPEFQPEWGWVAHLICQAEKLGIPYYMKPNLTVRAEGYPDGLL